MRIVFSSFDTRIRTDGDQAHERTVYFLDHKGTVGGSGVFISALLIVSVFYEYTVHVFFVRPPFSTLNLRHSPLRTTESKFFIIVFFFSDDTRIRTNEHQAHERKSICKTTKSQQRLRGVLLSASHRLFYEYTINAFL